MNGLQRGCLRETNERLYKRGGEKPKSSGQADVLSPFYDGVVGAHASGQQVVPVVEQLVVFAAVSHPQV